MHVTPRVYTKQRVLACLTGRALVYQLGWTKLFDAAMVVSGLPCAFSFACPTRYKTR